MINIRPIKNLPTNLGDFIIEIGDALESLYGPASKSVYLDVAENSYSRLIRHPDATFWACSENETPGLLICFVRRGIAHITLVHVLADSAGKGVEAALLEAAIAELRIRGVRAVIGEFVAHRPLHISESLVDLGFTRFDRQLMIADLSDGRLAVDGPAETSQCGTRDGLAADVLVDAYRVHPGRALHPETHDMESALGFLKHFRAGGFGATRPSFYRGYPLDDAFQGMIAGAEAAPDVGFILHVAAVRSSQGSGVGTRLIREVGAAFRRAGFARVALGVTCGNPAEQLYGRLGFEPLMPVETYVWWV